MRPPTPIAGLAPQRSGPEALRVQRFALLLVASMVVGGIGGADQHLLPLALPLLWMPAYLLWVVSDLKVRGVVGSSVAVQFLIAFVPYFGLLLYLLGSRRLAGVGVWLAFVAAVTVPALLTAGLAHGVAALVRGERW